MCINLLRHPAWGRAQETYGEDPHPPRRDGRGARARRAAPRDGLRQALRLQQHGERALLGRRRGRRARAARGLPAALPSASSTRAWPRDEAYNSVNGEWCGQNRALLTDILRGEWGFEGFVISDFIFGLRDAAASLRAGLDIEMPFRAAARGDLPPALGAATPRWDDVDAPPGGSSRPSCASPRASDGRRREPTSWSAPRTARWPARRPRRRSSCCATSRSTAARCCRSTRARAAPGRPRPPRRPPNTGDHGSSDVRPPRVVTPLEGLREALPGVEVARYRLAAAAVAAEADAAVVVVGYTAEDEGEYVGEIDPPRAPCARPAPALDDEGLLARDDRRRVPGRRRRPRLLTLSGRRGADRRRRGGQPATVVVIMAGSAVIVERWRASVPAIVVLWYPGSEGGRALADVLLGRRRPGRTAAVRGARRSGPPAPTSTRRWTRSSTTAGTGSACSTATATRRVPARLRPVLHSFALSDLEAAADGERLGIAVNVANTGERPGGHVVQVYAQGEDTARVLVGFRRVELDSGHERARAALAAAHRPRAAGAAAVRSWWSTRAPAGWRSGRGPGTRTRSRRRWSCRMKAIVWQGPERMAVEEQPDPARSRRRAS